MNWPLTTYVREPDVTLGDVHLLNFCRGGLYHYRLEAWVGHRIVELMVQSELIGNPSTPPAS